MLVIGVVALIVIGPKELPRVLRQVGQAIGKLRRMAGEFQGQFMDAMKEAELDDLRKEAAKLADATKLDVNFNPLKEADALQKEIASALDVYPKAAADDPSGVSATLPQPPEQGELILPEPVDLAPDPTPAPGTILPEPAETEPAATKPVSVTAVPSGPDPR